MLVALFPSALTLRCAFLAFSLFWMCLTPGRAHVADTSLLRINILPDRIRIEFNLDLQTLTNIQPLDLDDNGEVEQTEFGRSIPALHQFFQDHVQLSFEGYGPSKLNPIDVEWQSVSLRILQPEFRNAHVQFIYENVFPEGKQRLFRLQPKVFETFGTNHRIILGVVEGDISEQAVLTQTEPAIEYAPRSLAANTSSKNSSHNPRDKASAPSGLLSLFTLGVEHILTGYDHLLFLFTLLLAASRWGQMVACISAFTCAHSITLALAALEIARIPNRWVESAIAASIAWVAIQNMRQTDSAASWKQTFAFGLIHGFGFAALFRELNLPKTEFVRGVLAFNLGVEAGQIAILMPVLPILLAVRSRPWHPHIRRALSTCALLLALLWLWERLQS